MISQKSHLDSLEAESIYIFREVMSYLKKPVLLYSIGKDSSVLLHLAKKAFYPYKIPFPLLHIDTGWKFSEMYRFKETIIKKYQIDIITYKNKEGESNNVNPITKNSSIYTDIMKTKALKDAIDMYKFDFSFGGARRDEEKSRAKERIFSLRSSKHVWDPKKQRPELWNIYNLNLNKGDSMRVFPLSNWTEVDIWSYIKREKINLVELYFAKKRPVITRNGMFLLADDKRLKIRKNEKIVFKNIRFRTLGCYPLTAAIESKANTIDKIIQEITNNSYSERQGRLIDNDKEASMEAKKLKGYF